MKIQPIMLESEVEHWEWKIIYPSDFFVFMNPFRVLLINEIVDSWNTLIVVPLTRARWGAFNITSRHSALIICYGIWSY